jgi:hypothetical protein
MGRPVDRDGSIGHDVEVFERHRPEVPTLEPRQ